MELCSLNSLRLSRIIPPNGLLLKPFLRGRTINIPPCINNKRYGGATKLRILDCRAPQASSVGSEARGAALKDVDSKDSNLVFVAGATGRVGSRTVRELLKLGFRVRAGVRNRQRAQSLVQSVEQMKLDDSANGGTQRKRRTFGASVTFPAIENLEIVECDLEKPDRIVPALGNASIVICCIGASEKEVFDITGPYRIDYLATKKLIDAATFAKVDHFILLTSLGTNKVGFPAAILNLFWGVLIWKRRAEEALFASGLPYTIVRPGGMERPTDSYKKTHNIMLSEEDTLFGGQVSNLQVAELMAFMAKNRSLSYCKVVEVIAETTAPLIPMGDLLAKIPSQRVEVYPPKESGDADGPQAAVTEIKTADPPSAVKEPSPTKPTSKGLLSPYTAYDDLKPPTSPTPSQPSNREASISEAASSSAAADSDASKITKMEAAPSEPKSSTSKPQTRPLSPYTVYEDLKPPSSPSPTPSGPRESSNGAPISSDITSKITGGNDQVKTETTSPVEKDPPPSSASRHSPYLAYEDLKPPSSPSPSVPIVSGNSKPLPPLAEKSEVKQQNSTVKQKPLSPFTMYEDLKPPSSPTPSLKKQ